MLHFLRRLGADRRRGWAQLDRGAIRLSDGPTTCSSTGEIELEFGQFVTPEHTPVRRGVRQSQELPTFTRLGHLTASKCGALQHGDRRREPSANWRKVAAGAGLFPGDIAVGDRARTAVDGSIVLALLAGEFTVKRYRKKGARTPNGMEPETRSIVLAP